MTSSLSLSLEQHAEIRLYATIPASKTQFWKNEQMCLKTLAETARRVLTLTRPSSLSQIVPACASHSPPLTAPGHSTQAGPYIFPRNVSLAACLISETLKRIQLNKTHAFIQQEPAKEHQHFLLTRQDEVVPFEIQSNQQAVTYSSGLLSATT